MSNALTSKYIIDGVPQEFSPVELLGGSASGQAGSGAASVVIDETVDPVLETHSWNPADLEQYYARISETARRFPLPYSDVHTRCRMASALLDALWQEGHFCLEDLSFKAEWKWNPLPVGSQAAFYRSVQAAADYSDALGLEISSFDYEETSGDSSVSFEAVVREPMDIDDDIEEARKPELKHRRMCPASVLPDPSSWLVYVPFDTSDYRLGGSLLAQAVDLGGGVSPQIEDADYFMDCYEVVRELVEDGVVMSGVTVGDGGLLCAARSLCAGGPGAVLDLSDALKAFEEQNIVRVLFAEVPGVLLQVRDTDFDYIDAEFLLQDVAFFPLGHPNLKSNTVRVKASAKTGIQTILESLMQNAEGED